MAEPALVQRLWGVGALCRAAADALSLRLGAVRVHGEIVGWVAAASGHCYFTLKDAQGQLRCAMFRRAAQTLGRAPRDGDAVEVVGRLTVYEPRGDLQLVVEALHWGGAGQLYEQYLLLKARLETQGLFDASRKRPLPGFARGIGLVTSLGAAALRDVAQTWARRAPHVPVVLVPAAVQGLGASAELIASLQKLYLLAQVQQASEPIFAFDDKHPVVIDVIVLVRGGGSMQDLWTFNDEALVRTIAAAPVPLITGIGHETDVTLADWVADVRAATPTAAAERVAVPRVDWLDRLADWAQRAHRAVWHDLQRRTVALDHAAYILARPLHRLTQERSRLQLGGHALHGAAQTHLLHVRARLDRADRRFQLAADQAYQCHAKVCAKGQSRLAIALHQRLQALHTRLAACASRLDLLDPQRVLARGYAWLSDDAGQPLSRVAQLRADQGVRATLVDGTVDLVVRR